MANLTEQVYSNQDDLLGTLYANEDQIEKEQPCKNIIESVEDSLSSISKVDIARNFKNLVQK